MSAQPTFRVPPSAELAGFPELTVVTDTQNPSQLEEGFFESEQSDESNPVVKQELVEVNHSKRGTTRLEIFTLENGRHHEVVTATPRHTRSDIAVYLGTALDTSILGHNWRTMLKIMDLKIPVVMIGPEGGRAKWPRTPAGWKNFTQNLLSIDLKETAANAHEILNVTDTYGLYEAGRIIKTGESRDAGVAMGFNAQAAAFGREVVYTDAIAPPFPIPKPLKANFELVSRAGELVTQVGSLAMHSRSLSWRSAVNYPRTINLNPYFKLHVAATVPTLVNGRAGQLARQIPQDAKMHNTNFTEDPWTSVEGWEEIFADHTGVVNDRQPGDHGDIMRPETQTNRISRLRALRDELDANHQAVDRICWENVHMGGRLAVAA